MKSRVKILAILATLFISSLIFTKQVSAQQSYVSYQIFYDQLSPYGYWVDYPDYGYVWIPDEGSDFVPYSTRGHWILSEYGWTWVSDYSWGWAPFHYGRWDFDNYYGWFWIPDNEWGPAWVSWRRSNGYYGWAPLEPGISISVSFGRQYDSRNDHWIFVRDRDIDRSDINRYYVNRSDHDRIIRNSTVINNTYVDNRRNSTYVAGPDRGDVQKNTGRRVNPVAIDENNAPGQEISNGRLRIYRPQVSRNTDSERKPAPSRIVTLKEVKQPSERNVTNQTRNVNVRDNNRQVRQQEVVKPQNNNYSEPVQQQNADPVRNVNRRGEQLNTVTPKKNNSEPVQQRNANPTPDNRKVQSENAVKPSKNNRNEQAKKSKSEQDRKKEEKP
jgi:hypothetical protein